MKPVAYDQLAESELIKSVEFYEGRNPLLGDEFLAVIEETIDFICRNPQLGSPGKFGTRSWKTRRFPFRIVYLEEPNRFLIVAVAHLSRRPNYWRRRLH